MSARLLCYACDQGAIGVKDRRHHTDGIIEPACGRHADIVIADLVVEQAAEQTWRDVARLADELEHGPTDKPVQDRSVVRDRLFGGAR